MKNKKILIILDISTDKDIHRNECSIVRLDKGRIILKNFKDLSYRINFKNNNSYYNKIISSQIIKYLKKFRKYLPLKDLLLTEVANLRDDKIELYDKIKSILEIKKLNLEKNFEIEIITDKEYAKNIYNQVFKKFKITDFSKKNKTNYYIKFLLSRTRFTIKLFLIKIYLKFFGNKYQHKNKLALSIYPIMHTNKNDNFYINNDFLYLNFLIADETHTDTRIFNVIKKINFLSNKKLLFNIEQNFKITDIFFHYVLSLEKLKLLNYMNSQKLVVNKINFDHLFQNYFFISILNFLKLESYRRPLVNFFMKNKQIKEFHYFLFEYNFGFFLSETIKSKKFDIKLYGYQHGIFGNNTPWFDIIKKFNRFNFTPDKIFYRYKESKKTYLKKISAVYKSNLYNTNNFNKKLIPKISKSNNNCLIFLGLHDGEDIINQILQDTNFRKNFKKIYIKYHPKKKNLIFNYPNDKITFVNNANKIKVKKIYMSSSSSLSYIFKDLKIPFNLINIPYKSYKK